MSPTDTVEADQISDEELTRLALAADPDATVPDDAVPVSEILGEDRGGLLPSWYMPASLGQPTTGRRWKRAVVILIVIAFVAINAYGLCSTYGSITAG